MHFHSLRTRLSLAYALFLLLVVGLGVFSIRQLDDYNRVTAEIRDRWLQSTRWLGDLNNDTSDFRAAEGSYLLADTAEEKQAILQEMDGLETSIDHSLTRYQTLYHDEQEDRLVQSFLTLWRAYRALVAEERKRDRVHATVLYRTQANSTYGAASETLGHLTQWNLVGARSAAERESLSYRHANLWIVAAMLLAGVLLFSAIGFITRSISNPLLDLAQRMQRIANRELEIPLHALERTDEIGLMARAVAVFQDNARDLLATQQRLAEQAQSLERALLKEQDMKRRQHNFVLMTSHEFRSPLALIDGHAQRLYNARDRLGPEDVGERAQKIRRAIQRLTRLLDGLVDMPHELPFHPQQVHLDELLHRLIQEFQELFPERMFQGEIQVLPVMTGDPELLHRALGNLLSNAVKYSAPDQAIVIKAWAIPGRVMVDVTDRGVGIPDRDLPHLGEAYYRGSNVGAYPGMGVGLFLVQQILDVHHGHKNIDSREHEGTTIRLSFEVDPVASEG